MSLPQQCIVHIPAGSQIIQDADEEIMELYMARPSDSDSTGASALGYLSSQDSTIHVELRLARTVSESIRNLDIVPPGRRQRKATDRTRKSQREQDFKEVSLQLHQDLGTLHSEKGDTGSVLWRSSIYLARTVLQQHHFPSPHTVPLLDSVSLSRAAVLELGSGTGLLAILMSPLCKSYTASDLLINLRLCSRNLQLNGIDVVSDVGNVVRMKEINWFDMPTSRGFEVIDTSDYEYDLILAVDCVFNEALAIPLINTMNRYCRIGSRTVALVVVELRSPDVVTFFLQAWIEAGWNSVRLAPEQMGLWEERPGNWVGWVGWRS